RLQSGPHRAAVRHAGDAARQSGSRPRLWLARSADHLAMTVADLARTRTIARARSVWALRWQRLRRHRAGMASLLVLGLLVLFCLSAAPLEIALGIDATATDLLSRYEPPSARHWLGTDE